MKNILATILLSAFIINGQNATAQSLAATRTDTLLSYYNQLLEFNGNVLLARDGKEIIHKGYGYRIVDKEMICDTNTIFQIGEVTQSITATVVLMLHEQGKLNIKDKLSKYYPEYPNGDKITIEHLLTHTSGIYDYADSMDFIQNQSLISHSKEEMLDLFKDQPLTSVPGKEYNNSLSNYLLLGYIVEKATGNSYYSTARSLIFEPLGMQHSGFAYNQYASWDKATGHYIMRPNRLMPAPNTDSTALGAAGSMFSTASDLYKWSKAVIQGKFLSDSMWKRALTPYKDNFGYGWHINRDTTTGNTFIDASGTTKGFHAKIRLSLKDKTSIIILMNDMGDDPAPILRKVTAILYDKPFEYPTQKQPVLYPEKILREYEGMYELDENTDLRVYYEEQMLKGFIIGQDPFPIIGLKKKDQFYLNNSDVTIHFVRNREGKITSMVIRQNGKDLNARKWR